jgi:hypothetical protein
MSPERFLGRSLSVSTKCSFNGLFPSTKPGASSVHSSQCGFPPHWRCRRNESERLMRILVAEDDLPNLSLPRYFLGTLPTYPSQLIVRLSWIPHSNMRYFLGDRGAKILSTDGWLMAFLTSVARRMQSFLPALILWLAIHGGWGP